MLIVKMKDGKNHFLRRLFEATEYARLSKELADRNNRAMSFIDEDGVQRTVLCDDVKELVNS